jgi:glycosyltransferase involved in cell wall biosynthesis
MGYRPFPVSHVDIDVKKDIDFLTVGVSRFFDRKNLSLLPELGIRSRTLVVGEPNPPIGVRQGVLTRVPVVTPDYHAFTLPSRDLHTLYARSRFYLALSVSEGVGLPPVEASLHGVIPVYVDGHGFHDNLTGLPVDVRDEYTLEVDGYFFRVWEPFLHDLKYEVNHALTMPREEYEDLKAKVQERARDYEQKAFLRK